MRWITTAIVFALVALAGIIAAAQTPPESLPAPPPQVQEPAPPPELPEPPPGPMGPEDFERITYARPVVRVGAPYTLGAGAAVRDASIIMADATVAGRVLGDLVVVLGNLRLDATAVVEGSVVVVGGQAAVVAGAVIERDFVVVGGGLDAPVDFVPGGQQVLVGPPALGSAMRDVAPWFTRGLLWGRVIVPELGWIWAVVGIVLLVNLAITLAFPAAINATVDTLSARPVGSLFAGLLTLLLYAPVVTILAISVVGIAVIPFLTCAMVIGWVLGKVAVATWMGRGIMRQDDLESRGQTLRSFAIGFAIILLVYMIPLLGLAAWAIVGVLGLGTATLTLVAGLKRERPVTPVQPAPPAAPPPVPPAPMAPPEPAAPYGGAAASAADAYVPPAAAPFHAAAPPPPPGAAAVRLPPTDLSAFPRATFTERMSAAAVDIVLVAIAYNLFDWWRDGRAFLVLLVGYHIVFWTLKGTTVGGIIFNLRVVRTDGAPLAPTDAVVRGLTSLLSAAALGLGFFWIVRDPERQAWHDRVAGTYVVTVPRGWPVG